MPSILKIRRDWSLLLLEIRKDRSPPQIFKKSEILASIRRDWKYPNNINVHLLEKPVIVYPEGVKVLFQGALSGTNPERARVSVNLKV